LSSISSDSALSSAKTLGNALHIPEALALAQDPEQLHQQQVPGRDVKPSPPRASVRDRLEVADQVEIGSGRNALVH
jgi:hypothetical protein